LNHFSKYVDQLTRRNLYAMLTTGERVLQLDWRKQPLKQQSS